MVDFLKMKSVRVFAVCATIFLSVLFYKTAFAATTISTCQTISSPGDYVLDQNLSNPGATCLEITTSGVNIDGAGFSVTGDIYASAPIDGAGGSGYPFSVTNMTVFGALYSDGATNSAPGGAGGNGGNITLTDANVNGGYIYTRGASGTAGDAGAAGADCNCDDGDGSPGSNGNTGGAGGNGGIITMYGSSNSFASDSSGGNGGDGGPGGPGGSGGINSGSAGATGLQGEGGHGGNGGNIFRSSNSSISSETLNYGSGGNGNSGAAGAGTVGVEYVDLPSVTMTSPANAATISGSAYSVAATADVYVGPSISGVKFYINSTLIGSEDTTNPYSVNLDTTGYADGAYTISAAVRNSSDIYATSTVSINIDNSAPVISSVATSTIADVTGTVTWTTNESSDSRVWYGTSSGTYSANQYSASAVTSHTINLTGLTALTRYYFVVVSTNAGGVTATSSEYSFTTQETWTARDSSRSWRGIASSADGTKLVAVASSANIYTSTDSGANWTSRDSSRSWWKVTSSSDGTKLAAVVSNGQIYTSTDSGANWTPRDSSRAWLGIASSADGTKLVAVVISGQIYTSTDSGVNWTPRDSSRVWAAVASSADGTKLVAVVNNGQIYTSTDSGVNWTPRDSSRAWIRVTSSSDGTKLAAAVTGGYIYTSTDSGANWTARTGPGTASWIGIASSDDGTKLAAAASSGYIYTSTDSGATWTQKYSAGSRSWQFMTSSSDGTKLAAAAQGGNIYTATEVFPDTTAPTLSGGSSIGTTNDTTPNFTFTTDEAGTISYGGSCSSGTTAATLGSNTITFNALTAGTYSNCTVTVTDSSNNASNALSVASFTIDTTAPAFSSVAPATSASIDNVTSSSDITYTLSEALTSGSTTITRTSGTDGSSPHVCTLKGTALNSGAHTLNLSDTTNGCTSDVSNLVSGAVYTFSFSGVDAAGNYSTVVSNTGVTFDSTAPTITNVSSDKAAGIYKAGDVIDIDVTFSEAVTSTGNVTVTLETGTTDRTCTFTVSNTTSGTCDYTVQAGDTSPDLTVNSISGTIADTAGNAMSNFTPATNLAANEAIVIDTTAPVLAESGAIGTVSDSTPDYTFTSTEAGVITYGGSCSSLTSAASSGSNVITLSTLADGTYSNCTITVTDATGNASSPLTITSFTIGTAVAETTSSSSGGNSRSGDSVSYNTVASIASRYLPTPITQAANEIFNNFVPDFLKPSAPKDTPIAPTPTPREPQPGLEGNWDLIPLNTIDQFVLADLPNEISRLVGKFPELGKVFTSLGVANVGDLSKIQDFSFNLPKIADSSNPPTEVVFAQTGEGQMDVSSSLDVREGGNVEQKIHTIGGKSLTLKIKPEGKADSVKGYLTFKRKKETAIINTPTNSMLASALIAVGSLGEKKQTTESAPELLVFAFEYTDPDHDGIYTADIETPKADGEYEVITVIDYKDKKQGTKELRMLTVVDPEGYIYEKDSLDRKIRIKNATVSIFQVTPAGESLWDAKKYGQDNPQITDKTGKYAFLVPEGKYSLSVESSGHALYKGEPFTVKEGNPVHENIELHRSNEWLYNLLDWKMVIILIILAVYITHLIERRKKKLR